MKDQQPTLFSPEEIKPACTVKREPKPYRNMKGYSCLECEFVRYDSEEFEMTGKFICPKTKQRHDPDDDACESFKLWRGWRMNK